VEVELSFNQPALSQPEKEIVIRAVAFKISVPLANVVEKKYNPITKVAHTTAANKLPLIIVPLNSNPNFPDMLAHCALINSAETKSFIQSKMATFDTVPIYALSRYPVYTPFFVKVDLFCNVDSRSDRRLEDLSNFQSFFE